MDACWCWIGPRRVRVPKHLCKPTGLYESDRVDLKRLRRLILDGRLVPCFPGE